MIFAIFIHLVSSSCCFESPITPLGKGQFWINLTIVESNATSDPFSFSLSFATVYHFPSPIALNEKEQPASCRLLNPSDIDQGSQWACVGDKVRFRVGKF